MAVYWQDIEEGMEIPAFSRTTTLMNWNRWASVNDEFVPMHMDDDDARANGQDAAFGEGPLRYSYLHSAVRDWIGDDGAIVSINAQYRGINYKGDTLTCSGRVTGMREDNGRHLVDLEIGITNQRGETVTPGQATVALPGRG